MPARILAGAMCVQRFDDSLNSAIRITYRISLRSSSMPEPRDPLLKVLIRFLGPAGGASEVLLRGVAAAAPVGELPGYRLRLWFSSGGRLGPGLRRARGDPAEATVGRVHMGFGSCQTR